MKQTEDEKPTLLVSFDRAKNILEEQLEKGRKMLERRITNYETLKQAREQFNIWNNYNKSAIKRIFSGNDYSNLYSPNIAYIGRIGPSNLSEDIEDFNYNLRKKINNLESIIATLDLFEDTEENGGPSTATTTIPGTKVFIVHGHDNGTKNEVVCFLQRIGLEPIVLHDVANGGRTLLEKFRDEADNVGLAIVILSPDDEVNVEGYSEGRARQNVVFEFGYFLSGMGREKVCVIKVGEVTIPSDLEGLVYIEKCGDSWKIGIIRELNKLGISYDYKKI